MQQAALEICRPWTLFEIIMKELIQANHVHCCMYSCSSLHYPFHADNPLPCMYLAFEPTTFGGKLSVHESPNEQPQPPTLTGDMGCLKSTKLDRGPDQATYPRCIVADLRYDYTRPVLLQPKPRGQDVILQAGDRVGGESRSRSFPARSRPLKAPVAHFPVSFLRAATRRGYEGPVVVAPARAHIFQQNSRTRWQRPLHVRMLPGAKDLPPSANPPIPRAAVLRSSPLPSAAPNHFKSQPQSVQPCRPWMLMLEWKRKKEAR